jgi:hypothetical protein
MLDSSLVQAIQRSQSRDRLIYFITAGFSFCLALFFLAGFIFGAEDFPPDKRPNLLIIGGVFCLMGAYLLFYAFKLQVDAVQLLTRSPHKIVWVYLQVRTGTSYSAAIQFQFVRFGLMNKKQFGVRLSPQACDALLQQMPSLFPHATLGYSPEIKQAFNRNPASLTQEQRF